MRYPLALAGLLLVSSAQAAPLTYAAALERAATTSPILQARVLQQEGARAAQRAAGALPNPRLAVGVDNFPISGPLAGRFNGGSMTMARVGLMQDMPNGAKRAAARARAQSDVQAADAAEIADAQTVRVGAATAWISLYYAERRLAALDGVLSRLGPLWASAPSSVASGEARPGQSLEAEQFRADLEDRRSEVMASVGRARAELARWTGEADADVAGPPPTFEVDVATLRAAVIRHPRLAEQYAMTAQAEADVQAARADRRPDWSWQVAYQRRDPMFGDMVSAVVTVSLPLFGGKRQDPIIAAKVAAAGQARAEREAARRELSAQLDAALADRAMHHEQWMRAQSVLLPLAQKRADLETASYAASRAALSDVLQAFTALANAQLTLLDREAAVTGDDAALVLTYGNDPS